MSDYQTTVRLDATLKSSVDHLKSLQKTTLNRLINDALAKYIGEILDEKQGKIDATQQALQAYLMRDPDFESAIAAVAASESAGDPDPVEGRIVTQTVPRNGETHDEEPTSIVAILDG